VEDVACLAVAEDDGRDGWMNMCNKLGHHDLFYEVYRMEKLEHH
jgi:hypothetical protein